MKKLLAVLDIISGVVLFSSFWPIGVNVAKPTLRLGQKISDGELNFIDLQISYSDVHNPADNSTAIVG